jgi:hypothetical protein
VPVEGQWDRVNAPLPARDRRVLAIAACVLVLVLAGAAVALVVHRSPSDAGCVVVTVPSTMGGAVIRRCGPAAKTFCRTSSDLGDAAAQCARLGDPTRRL